MAATFKPLRKTLLSQEVEIQLKKSITDGNFLPGEKLPTERELCDQFQVSRVTIREALKSLKKSGLIITKRGMNAGAYVCELTADAITESFHNLIQMGKVDYDHLIQARLYIEPATARTVALQADPKSVENLSRLLDHAEKLTETSCRQARLINVSFHCEVAKMSGNPIVQFITESVTQGYSEFLIEKTKSELNPKEVLTLIDQHREIVDALIKKDADLAHERTRTHLEKARTMYKRLPGTAEDSFVP
ncbi:MAG: FadR family transcriptional regulator [Desulfobacterales bacterium]|nr:FadR family transcriptional regulator [Desulfobacterales bacterium]